MADSLPPPSPLSSVARCEGRYPVPQTSPPRDEPFEVTYRCARPKGHDGPHGDGEKDFTPAASPSTTPEKVGLTELLDDYEEKTIASWEACSADRQEQARAAARSRVEELFSSLQQENERLKTIAQDNYDSFAMLKDRLDRLPPPEDVAAGVVQRIVELDYTPPEDFDDDMVMCTTSELSMIIADEARGDGELRPISGASQKVSDA